MRWCHERAQHRLHRALALPRAGTLVNGARIPWAPEPLSERGVLMAIERWRFHPAKGREHPANWDHEPRPPLPRNPMGDVPAQPQCLPGGGGRLRHASLLRDHGPGGSQTRGLQGPQHRRSGLDLSAGERTGAQPAIPPWASLSLRWTGMQVIRCEPLDLKPQGRTPVRGRNGDVRIREPPADLEQALRKERGCVLSDEITEATIVVSRRIYA